MRQTHATCDARQNRALSTGLFVRRATVVCCCKKVEIIQLSCDSIQQSHVASRMFLSHRVNALLGDLSPNKFKIYRIQSRVPRL